MTDNNNHQTKNNSQPNKQSKFNYINEKCRVRKERYQIDVICHVWLKNHQTFGKYCEKLERSNGIFSFKLNRHWASNDRHIRASVYMYKYL